MQLTMLHSFFHSLSWTFIHSIWQGLILSIAAGLVMLITKRSAASLRYALLCCLFFLFLGGVVFTFIIELNEVANSSPALKITSDTPESNAIFSHRLLAPTIEKLRNFLDSNSGWIVLAWVIILVFNLTRMMLDIMYLARLRKNNIHTPGNEWKIKLESLCDQMGIRKKITLLQSTMVRVPIVMGHLKPVILVPVGILSGLPPAEVEAVLLHELAHIRRHDYLVNFIQRVAEMFFFFNPPLLWISSLLRIERENCCDDIAIAKTKSKVQFVGALISFKEHSLKNSSYSLGLFGKKDLLIQRVSRIVYNRTKALSPWETVFVTINLILFALWLSFSSNGLTPNASAPLLFASNIDSPLVVVSEPQTEIVRVWENKPAFHRKKIEVHFRETSLNKLLAKTKEIISPRQHVKVPDIQPKENRDAAEQSKLQADKDRAQAEKDRLQAEEDRKQANKDREQAEKDRQQAEKDRQQAEKDRLQAVKDREQAELDRKNADKDREEMEKTRVKIIAI